MNKVLKQRTNDKVEDIVSKKRESKVEVLYNKQISDINELKQIIKSKDEENKKLIGVIMELKNRNKLQEDMLSRRKAYQRKTYKYLMVDYATIKYILKLDAIV
jgi:hypothetical protein